MFSHCLQFSITEDVSSSVGYFSYIHITGTSSESSHVSGQGQFRWQDAAAWLVAAFSIYYQSITKAPGLFWWSTFFWILGYAQHGHQLCGMPPYPGNRPVLSSRCSFLVGAMVLHLLLANARRPQGLLSFPDAYYNSYDTFWVESLWAHGTCQLGALSWNSATSQLGSLNLTTLSDCLQPLVDSPFEEILLPIGIPLPILGLFATFGGSEFEEDWIRCLNMLTSGIKAQSTGKVTYVARRTLTLLLQKDEHYLKRVFPNLFPLGTSRLHAQRLNRCLTKTLWYYLNLSIGCA